MRFGSICAGIEAASVAWHPLGWETAWVSEIDAFPSAVLKHHYPDVPNLGDITKEDFIDRAKANGPIQCLIGGTPCQSFSLAGLRTGLADDRGNLALRYMQAVNALRPPWVIWENVPGVLSSNGGRDFGAIVGALEQCGYGWAYRILDAVHFGVPQRRRRVFLVGYLGDWRRATAVLFERSGLSGHSQKSRKAGQKTASAITASAGHHGHSSPRGDGSDNLVAPTLDARCADGPRRNQGGLMVTAWDIERCRIHDARQPAPTLAGADGQGGHRTPTVAIPYANSGSSTWSASAPRLGAHQGRQYDSLVAFQSNSGSHGGDIQHDVAPPLRLGGAGGNNPPAIASTMQPKEADLASTQEDHAITLLRNVREEVGEETLAQWGFGVLVSFYATEILQQALHGTGLRCPTWSKSWPIYCAISCAENRTQGAMQSLRESQCQRRASHRWQLSEQCARELGAYLSWVSHASSSAESIMRHLWEAAEGFGILQQALSALQKMGQPALDQDESTQSSMQIRRLTPTECEFLQHFPRNYTRIPWRGKAAADCPDGPRYKALGNSMATPVVRWIGQRIQNLEEAISCA